MQKSFATFGTAIFIAATSFAPANAGYGQRSAQHSGTVTACSENGHFACYTAPVRTGRSDNWMRLKGGTWISCDGDCRATLRKTTVDFWDTQRENGN